MLVLHKLSRYTNRLYKNPNRTTMNIYNTINNIYYCYFIRSGYDNFDYSIKKVYIEDGPPYQNSMYPLDNVQFKISIQHNNSYDCYRYKLTKDFYVVVDCDNVKNKDIQHIYIFFNEKNDYECFTLYEIRKIGPTTKNYNIVKKVLEKLRVCISMYRP